MSFTPTPFATPVVAPTTITSYRSAPYISVSEYRFAPTTVGTKNLNPGPTNETDSDFVLAETILRASGMMDEYVFHGRQEASLAATLVTEQMAAKPKPNGSLVLICNFKPTMVIGVATGPNPSQMTNISSSAANTILVGETTITLPNIAGEVIVGNQPDSGGPFYGWGPTLAIYSYVTGWPHATLGANVAQGATSLTLTPAFAGDSQIYGLLAGQAFKIVDDDLTETVVVESVSGLTVTLKSGTLYAHTVPQAPDSIPVTSLPWFVEQACISATSFLLKARGFGSQVAGAFGSATPGQRKTMAEKGMLSDYDVVCGLLHPLRRAYYHGLSG